MKRTKPARTTSVRPDAPHILDVAHLGGRGALYLLALLQAHHSPMRLAPTVEGTHAVLTVLATLGLIRVDLPGQSEGYPVVGADKHTWAYTWAHAPLEEVEGELRQFLLTEARNPAFAPAWLGVWQELLPQEIYAYLQHQLRIHHFGDFYLAGLPSLLEPNDARYSLGHWRYACWATVRSMASVSLQYPGNVEIVKYTLTSELPRRLKLAQGSYEGKLCFSPSHSLPDSALTRVFSSVATPLEDQYWIAPPTLQTMLAVLQQPERPG